jgi:exosortase
VNPPAPLSLAAAWSQLSLLGKLNLVALAAAVVALSVRLWPEWSSNPDLSHGFFMPVVFFLLLQESRGGTPRFSRGGPAVRFGFAVLLAGSIGALCLAGLYAAAVDWSHALVDLMLTAALALLMGAALLVYSRASVRLLSLNWSAAVAIGLWFLAAPIPPGTYTRLTLGLQLWVSEGVLRALHLLGIAAVRHGNLIDLANATVGVEEACSGVRSLVSCIFAGLLFSATLVRRPWSRALLIGLAAPLALAMNFIRSLALTLLANAGVDIAGTWHDATGFAVLGITAALLGGLAVLLERKPAAVAPPAPPAAPPPRAAGLERMLAGGLALTAALVTLFVANTRPTPDPGMPAPDLMALLPATAPGWSVKTSDLYQFRGTLKTENLAQRHYVTARDGTPTEIVIYVAYWRAGQAPVSLVASHTPDACWPGAGWTALAVDQPRVQLEADARRLPAAEHRLFMTAERPQHVWFWHVYNGRVLSYRDPYSAIELLRLAVRYGFRRAGDQVFVRVSSNRPWAEIADAPVLGQFFARMRPLGL